MRLYLTNLTQSEFTGLISGNQAEKSFAEFQLSIPNFSQYHYRPIGWCMWSREGAIYTSQILFSNYNNRCERSEL